MKKIFVLIVITIFIVSNKIFANPVSSQIALTIAKNYYQLQYYRTYKTIPNYKSLTINPVNYNKNVSYWVVTFSKSGFVIVSGDDSTFPIIGY